MAARKKDDKDQPTYAAASAELESILHEIETGDTDIDVLSEQVERAAELIKFCREKLAGTELRVNRVVAQLTEDSDRGEDES